MLDKANFFFPANETTFLVGTSGSGKSTVGNLIMRYYEPLSGEILIDGNPVQNLDTNWLRRNVTLIQQDNVLFNETILQNIAFGKRADISREDVLNASQTGCLSETLRKLPEGIDTVVGSHGRSLSGGQRQRIAIARARLRDSPILILDEATSALDLRGRIEVMRAVREWRKGKTTVIITHDLSQIQEEDYVYVLENARVIQEGYRRKLASKVQGTFASILRGETNTIAEAGRNAHPGAPIISTFDSAEQEYPDRWSYISKVFGIGGSFPDSVQMRMRSPRMSLGLAVAQANEIRSETIWQNPVIPQSPAEGQSLAPYSEHIPSLHFLSPRPAPDAPNLVYMQKQGRERPRSISPFLTGIATTSQPRAIDPAVGSPWLARRLGGEGRLANAPETQNARQPASLAKIFRTILPSITCKERIVFIFGFFSAFITAAATPAFAYVFARLQNTFYITENQFGEARKWALILLVIGMVDGISSYCARYALEYSGQAWINSLRLEALKRILAQPKAWFDMKENSPEELNDCLDRNAEEMRNLVGRFAGLAFTVIVMLAITIIWALFISWRLTLVALACGPITYIVIRGFSFVSGKWERKCNEVAQLTNSIFTETFSNIRVVRALTLEAYFERKHRQATVNAYRIGVRRAAYSGSLFGLSDSMSLFIIALVYYYGGILFTTGSNTVASILQVVNLLLLGVANSSAILAMVPQISSSRATATQMLYLASLPLRDSHEATGSLRLASPLPIRMNSLSFSYPNQTSVKNLDRVSLKIESGTCTAIVGPSGGGKSTIASILLGIYAPDKAPGLCSSPTLTFNGKCISVCNIVNLRSFISFIPQSPLLFPTTILENIFYGLSENSPFRIFKYAESAASQAGIHTFISSLEHGYNTQIGDGGMGLSGGQAQRINIARALVRRPQVLILDEATSALDGENAEGIRQVIRTLIKEGVAVVMISHDVDMMRIADRIIVVEAGRIVETGGFEELLNRGDAFARLLGEEKQNLGLGLDMEERVVSPIEVRKRESWIRKPIDEY